jgi:aspartate kinase
MGKTTNGLEELVQSFIAGDGKTKSVLDGLKIFHFDIAKELISDKKHNLFVDLDDLFFELECMLDRDFGGKNYDFIYDQIVTIGEFISSKIVSNYLHSIDYRNKWVDARNFIVTDNNFREARVDWETTENLIRQKLRPFCVKNTVITQGFIGKDINNDNTTLGREGSDYSAAIFAYCLDAEQVTIWKDVAGVMNADPKRMPDAVKLDHLSYRMAIELAYYGASVIHPKTIQPLQSKNIPLYVNSFIDPGSEGTIVDNTDKSDTQSCFIFKDEQMLIQLSTKNFSFIVEENLRQVFDILASQRVRVNLMQNSAISFELCADFDPKKIEALEKALGENYNIRIKPGCRLITVYNADFSANYEDIVSNGSVLLEQHNSRVIQWVIG